MNSKKNILLVYTNYSTFVKTDFEILSEKHAVDRYHFHASKKLVPFLLQFIRQLFFLAVKGWRYDIFFLWFADYHSFLPSLFSRFFKKKSILIIGGFDAVSLPEIEFGLFYKNNLRTRFGRLSYQMANFILPVDESLIQSTNYYVNPEGQEIGFLHYVNGVKGKIETIPTGYDPYFWKRTNVPIEWDVITVGGCSDWKTFRRKGHDFYIELARLMPELQFTLVGINPGLQEEIKASIPLNMHVYGFVNQDEMIELFSSHKVFTQFSLSEGLPNTLCEAMLCGCIPVGSEVNGIPHAIGDSGFILKRRNLYDARKLIGQAMSCNDRIATRERIIAFFDLKKRKNGINRIIDL